MLRNSETRASKNVGASPAGGATSSTVCGTGGRGVGENVGGSPPAAGAITSTVCGIGGRGVGEKLGAGDGRELGSEVIGAALDIAGC